MKKILGITVGIVLVVGMLAVFSTAVYAQTTIDGFAEILQVGLDAFGMTLQFILDAFEMVL